MINAHQPTIFPDWVIVRVSSADDGNMKQGDGFDAQEVTFNRKSFLKRHEMDYEQTHLVRLNYGREDYCRYDKASEQTQLTNIGQADVHITDALVHNKPGEALFLPLADCCGLALVDTAKRKIMLSHVGRHSAEQNGARKSVEYMAEQFGSEPADIVAWLSPAAGKSNFPIFALDNKGLHQVIIEQLKLAGIPDENIETSEVDTTTDGRYFSHSEFLKGHRPENGRFAVAMMIKP